MTAEAEVVYLNPNNRRGIHALPACKLETSSPPDTTLTEEKMAYVALAVAETYAFKDTELTFSLNPQFFSFFGKLCSHLPRDDDEEMLTADYNRQKYRAVQILVQNTDTLEPTHPAGELIRWIEKNVTNQPAFYKDISHPHKPKEDSVLTYVRLLFREVLIEAHKKVYGKDYGFLEENIRRDREATMNESWRRDGWRETPPIAKEEPKIEPRVESKAETTPPKVPSISLTYQKRTEDLQGIIKYFHWITNPKDLETARLRLVAMGLDNKVPALRQLSFRRNQGNVLAVYNQAYFNNTGENLPPEDIDATIKIISQLFKQKG